MAFQCADGHRELDRACSDRDPEDVLNSLCALFQIAQKSEILLLPVLKTFSSLGLPHTIAESYTSYHELAYKRAWFACVAALARAGIQAISLRGYGRDHLLLRRDLVIEKTIDFFGAMPFLPGHSELHVGLSKESDIVHEKLKALCLPAGNTDARPKAPPSLSGKSAHPVFEFISFSEHFPPTSAGKALRLLLDHSLVSPGTTATLSAEDLLDNRVSEATDAVERVRSVYRSLSKTFPEAKRHFGMSTKPPEVRLLWEPKPENSQ